MWDTSGRLLRLLALLQHQQDWAAADLAAKLAVSTRTVRRDVDRLRAIGYPVDARPGVAGGYQLAPGTSLPPLMFDAGEAVATVLALRTANLHSTNLHGTDIADSVRSALTKLVRVIPPTLRAKAEALASQTGYTPYGERKSQPPDEADVDILMTAALGARERRVATAEYRSPQGELAERELEPLRLVKAGGRWYLVAWDLGRHDWRTFLVERLTRLSLTDRPAMPRTPPSEDIETYVVAQLGAGIQQQRAVVRVRAPRAAIEHWIDPAWGTIEELGEDECLLRVGADSLATIARWLLLLDAELTVVAPPALAEAFTAVAALANRTAASIGAPGNGFR